MLLLVLNIASFVSVYRCRSKSVIARQRCDEHFAHNVNLQGHRSMWMPCTHKLSLVATLLENGPIKQPPKRREKTGGGGDAMRFCRQLRSGRGRIHLSRCRRLASSRLLLIQRSADAAAGCREESSYVRFAAHKRSWQPVVASVVI